MSSWHAARVVQSLAVGPQLSRIALDVPAQVAAAFRVPGQFTRVRLDGQEAMFSMASAPADERFEFFVRTSFGVARTWAELPPGAQVELTLPEGRGFPIDEAKGRSLLLVGTGTGWAPLRSVLLNVRARRGDFAQVRGLYGALTPEHVVFDDELAALRDAGIDVQVTVSAAGEGWRGPVGFVQALLPAAGLDETTALLCGQPEMTAEVTALLTARGLPAGHAWLNF